jgi:glycerol-3-phosphate dehydrogenase
MSYDVAVIGAGVIGTAIARNLMRYNLKVIIIERDNDVSCGTTKANSAIVHAGYDASQNSLKGQFNVKGNALFDSFCSELSVPFKRIGSLVLALNVEDVEVLKTLKANGDTLGVPGLEIISREEVLLREPNVTPNNYGALFAPSAGITEPWELAIACAENAIDNGAELMLDFEVTAIRKNQFGYTILDQANRAVDAKLIINCAGIYADAIYNLVNDKPEFSIYPRRGQYFLLDKTADGLVNHILFPCPSKFGKGVLIVPTIDQNVLIGPDSEDLDSTDKEAVETSMRSLEYVKREASKFCSNIPFRENITTFSGLRAEPSGDDFIIEESSQVAGFYNVAGIKSPGLSSAPAIAEHVVDWVASRLKPALNPSYNGQRAPRIKFMALKDEEKQAMILEDSSYGRIICRCEMITEGEIVDAIRRPAGGRTLNGIKRRVRPGAGRCQGGFCGPRVLEILQRELGCSALEVLQEGKGSHVLMGRTKEMNQEVTG